MSDAKSDFGTSWAYAPAPESTEQLRLDAEYGLFIGGEFAPAAGGESFATISPSTEQPLARVALAGAVDVDRAVTAARAAYDGHWRRMKAAERGKYGAAVKGHLYGGW